MRVRMIADSAELKHFSERRTAKIQLCSELRGGHSEGGRAVWPVQGLDSAVSPSRSPDNRHLRHYGAAQAALRP